MREENYWRQRYEMLLANMNEMINSVVESKLPMVLASKESYELGKLHGALQERKECVIVCERINAQARYGLAVEAADCAEAIRARG